MNKLTGRIALVTGASKGIGAAVAAGLGAEGAYVYVNYCTDPTGAERTAAQIAAAGGQAETVGCDVASYEEIVEMFRRMRASRGAPDILVNCAGISPVRRFHELDRREIERVMNTNLMGAVYCSHEAVRSMKDTGGCIVNISSIHGTRAGVGRAVYAASKAGMNGLTRALASEYGGRVRVNALIVGSILTERTGALEGLAWDERPFIPAKRFGTPAEVAALVVFLAQDAAGFINGACIPIDGGASGAHVECGQPFMEQEFAAGRESVQ